MNLKMPSILRLALSALAASVSFCDAARTTTSTGPAVTWTVTSYVALQPTVSTYAYTYGTSVTTYTDTYTGLITVKPGITPTATPTSTSTRTRSYGSLEVVYMYVDGDKVPTSDIVPTSTYDRSATAYTYDQTYTSYVQEVVWTAPSSCPVAFTVETYQRVTDIPTEVLEQRTDLSTEASVSTAYDGDKYTIVTAYVPASAFPQLTTTASTDDYYYSYYVRRCTNPTAIGTARYPTRTTTSRYPTSTSIYTGNSSDDSDSDYWWYYSNVLQTWAIVLAAVLPGIFLIGFFESYFWFRRMMVGKFSLRFGTCCWIFLIWPIIFATRRCPARDDETQKTLREQWKKVGFGTALGLWFRWGFRHRYPVDLLGAHPQYHNPDPNAPAVAPMAGAPGTGFVYYIQGPPGPDGKPTFQQVMLPANQLPEGFKFAPQSMVAVPQGGAPPGPPTAMYYPYPQAPQPAYVAPQTTTRQQAEEASPALPPRSPPPTVPSPLSSAPQAPTSPPPPVPAVSPQSDVQPRNVTAGEERGESSRAAGQGGDESGLPPPPGAAK